MLTQLMNKFKLFIVFQLVFCRDLVIGLRLTELQVPTLADPRNNLYLGCKFDMGIEDLYSVKWYKDEQEFFSYTPSQQPQYKSFPVSGIHLVEDSGNCDYSRCAVNLTQLTTAHSGGSYRCEVSSEAPTFRVVFETVNVTVAAIGRYNPVVDGVKKSYASTDFVFANCTTAPADPAPTITWLINGKLAPTILLGQTKTSRPDGQGLVTKSRILRFHAEPHLFLEPSGTMQLQCIASLSDVPTKDLVTTVTATLHDLEQNALMNQKLQWFNNNAMSFVHNRLIIVATMAILHWQ